MEVTPSVQDFRGHADSLLAGLKLQRDLSQFCDCVIKQSSAHLFLAHRCILAASSPVLASLLASNGTLLELQAPCLSDSVLRVVLDYIYTGDLPRPTAQQQYCSLLTAASYLQMDKLKQDLKARQRTNTDDGENNLTTSTTAKHCSKITNDQPFSEDVYSKHTAVEIYTGLCKNSMEKQDHPISAKTFDDTHSPKISSCLSCSGNDCSRGSNILANATGTSDPEDVLGQKENSGELHSPGTDEPDELLRSTGELSRHQCSQAREAFLASSFSNGPSIHHRGGERSPTSSFSSPLSCSAVPVICHSGRATVLQPAETASLPHLYSGSQSSTGASIPSPPVPPQPASPKEGMHSNTSSNYVSIGAGDCDRPLAQNQHDGNEDKDPFGIQNWNYNKQSLVGCGIQHSYYKPTAVMTMDYKDTAHFGVQHKENNSTEHGLSQRTDIKDQLVHCGSIQCDNDTKHPSDDELTQHKDYKDFPNAEDYKDSNDEKHPPVEYFDDSMTTAEVEPTSVCRSLIARGTSIGRQYQYGDHCFGEREEAEEDSERDEHFHRTDRINHVTCPNTTMTHRRDGDQPEKESHTALASDTSYDPAYSYSGHLQYQCLSQEYTQQTHALSYTHSECKYLQHAHAPLAHPNLSGEWGGVGAHSDLNRRGAESQLLLLDISTTPARFLVSHEAVGGQGRSELETNDGAGGVEIGTGEQAHEMDGSSDGSTETVHQVRATSPREESSTDSSAITDGEERGLSACMPPELPVYVSAPTPSTLLISTPRSAPVGVSPSVHTLLQHSYHCTLCDRSFSQRGSLNRHMRSHLGVRPYPCPRCPMTFSRQYRVTEHMRVHQRYGPDEELHRPPAPPP